MKKLNRAGLNARGWNDEAIDVLLGRPNHTTETEELWDFKIFQPKEQNLSFKKFTTADDFYKRQELFIKQLEEQTIIGINQVKNLSIEFKEHDCLLKNSKKYNPFEPILHYVQDNFKPDPNGSYTLFTDGCFKSIGSQAFASCAGWILDNNTNKIIIEFTKVVELNDENPKRKGMPDFELTGINEGVKVIELLGIKNVQCYTDCMGEARIILAAVHNIGDSRINTVSYLYSSIIDTLQKTNSSIAWIPREYNSHADELTKVPLNAWYDAYKKSVVEINHFKDNNYIVDREKDMFFHNDKFSYSTRDSAKDRYQLIYNQSFGKDFILIYDTVNDSLETIHAEPRTFSHIPEELNDSIKRLKKNSLDGTHTFKLANEIKDFYHLPNLTICVRPGTVATCNKLTPIPTFLQEEYFELHKSFNDFPGNITITDFDKKLEKKIKNFLEKEFFPKPKKVKPFA